VFADDYPRFSGLSESTPDRQERSYDFEIESMYDWKGRLAGRMCKVSTATRTARA